MVLRRPRRHTPDEPGLRHIEVRPQPAGDLTWVKAKWETFRGPVTVQWKRTGRDFRLQVSLPPGIAATVVPPCAAPTPLSGAGAFACQL